VGTFLHGLGNYEAMRHDEDLPFINRIKYYVHECDKTEAESHRRFEHAARAVRRVFDVALDTLKLKFQQQTTAAVAAVIASTKGDVSSSKSTYVLQSQKLDDDDIITVSRLKSAALKAFRQPCDPLSSVPVINDRVGKGPGGRDILVPYCPLLLPDSKYLDHLLLRILNSFEEAKLLPKRISHSLQLKRCLIGDGSDSHLRKQGPLGRSLFDGCIMILDKKRPPDNDSDYFHGAASKELASVAVGADSSRYERGPCVPMVITRFGLGATLIADDSVVSIVSKIEVRNTKKEPDAANANPSPNDQINVSSCEQDSNHPINQNGSSHSAEIINMENPIQPQIKTLPVWQYIIDDTKLRASLCTSILFSGYPSSNESFVKTSLDFIDEVKKHSSLSFLSDTTKTNFFSMEDAVGRCVMTAGLDWSEKKESVEQYFQSVLFPHCLRLCLLLSGELNKIAISRGPSSVIGLNSIPDPFLPIECHSEEAMTRAYSMLRRAKLMKALRFIVGGGVPFSAVKAILHGPLLQQLTSEVPIWWCPWVHDLGLLMHTALYGLESTVTELPGLQRGHIEQHIREVFVDGKNPCLPRCFLNNATQDELNAWVNVHAEQFPAPIVIERRLALLCSELTKGTEAQYDNVPMYDGLHSMYDKGGWSSGSSSVNTSVMNSETAGRACLLVDIETQKS
jgi:hypothetical protein